MTAPLSSSAATHDRCGEERGNRGGDSQQEKPHRVIVARTVDQTHDQWRKEATGPARGTYDPGHRADPLGRHQPGDEREHRPGTGAERGPAIPRKATVPMGIKSRSSEASNARTATTE